MVFGACLPRGVLLLSGVLPGGFPLSGVLLNGIVLSAFLLSVFLPSGVLVSGVLLNAFAPGVSPLGGFTSTTMQISRTRPQPSALHPADIWNQASTFSPKPCRYLEAGLNLQPYTLVCV